MNAAETIDEAELVLVLSTEADPERAEALARQLLERRLVACVSLLPVQSLYRWQGGIESAAEVKLLLKSLPGRLAALREALHSLHSYQTPEWIVLQGRSALGYAAWLGAELASEPGASGGDDGTDGTEGADQPR